MPASPDDNKNENLANTKFISEKIKQRPINRKKLLRRTIITVSMAVVFGIVACLTFLLLQPIFSNRLYPEKEPAVVSLPEESASDELSPEEMYADDSQIAADEALSLEASQKDQIDEAIASYSFDSSDYGKVMQSLKAVATSAAQSMVTVTTIKNDTNWFSSSYESSGSASGLIVADNGTSIFILVPATAVSKAESIGVTFNNGAYASAEISLIDSITNQCIITVKRSTLTENTRQSIVVATLGSSNSNGLTGLPVIAIGSPIGVQDSIAYGIITSEKTPLDLADTDYKLLTTDIYGSTQGSGVLINLEGHVLGIIDMSYNSEDLPNHICAIGITEMKSLIEDLSNGKERAYLGVHGTTIPQDIQTAQNIPQGAYITSVEMSSPAMRAGLQSGDIITSVDGTEITTYEQLIGKLALLQPNDIITVTVMRQAPTDYITIELSVTLSSSTHD
ncbi:S1C family serine protease [Butyrivibrio proteoclasticus]|uniref:S1C family serine protease n=1 Tax=Butyrivibrio proteoclasticus TaxID=43305 RepID=UPI0006879BF7|nr:PDZ domain-containing protein [Butyrivibrio proteoclasticus]